MNEKQTFLKKLKHRWGVSSGWQLALILLVFSCTGFSSLYAKQFVYDILDIPTNLDYLSKVALFVVITFPLYNILLLAYGFIFGQFGFFWDFEKKFFSRIIVLFQRKAKRKSG